MDVCDFLLATTGAVIVSRTKGNYPAPMVAFETIMQSATKSMKEAAALESKAFADLSQTSVAKQLVRVYRLGERNRRDCGLGESAQLTSNESVHVNEVQKPSIVGAGIMGAGITARHVRSGFMALHATSEFITFHCLQQPWSKMVRGLLIFFL